MSRDLARVLDAALDGVVVLDARGTPVELLLGQDHSIAKLARSVLASGRTAIETERRVDQRFESHLVVDVAASPLFDANGRPDGVVIALRDRTIQHNLEEAVGQRERLAAFGRIAAGLAHEVKNPLGGIRGAAEILGARAADAKTLDAAELIVREVDRITALVDDMMVFARGDELREVPLNIHRVLDDVLDLLAMDPISGGTELVRSYDPSIPELMGDPDRLNQVLLNLLRNALQALEGEGGRIEITTRMTIEHRIAAESGHRLPTLLIEIADDGPGMGPEVLEQLATPFFTTRHGGTVRIESEPGQGTVVRVALPLRRAS